MLPMKSKLNFSCLQIFFLIFCFVFFIKTQAQPSSQIAGRVIDFDTRQPLKGVSIIVRENKQGTITDDSGFFSLNVPKGNITLHLSSVGYSHSRHQVDLSDNRALIITLKKNANEQLDEVVINANTNSSRLKATEMNTIKINPEFIKRTPLLLGEADIIKSLMLQPGVTTVGEGAGGFNVRGGNADQ